MTHREIFEAHDNGFKGLTVELCERYLKLHPNQGPVWWIYGSVLTDMADFKNALNALRKSWGCSPQKFRFNIAWSFGHLYRDLGKRRLAEKWYKCAIELCPNNSNLYIYLGYLYAQLGNYEKAEQSYRHAIRVASHPLDDAYLNLGYVLRARRMYKEAADCFSKSLQIDADDENARQALEDVEAVIQRFDGL
ncbi:MAG: tetratricopeptide repeat protein [Planctomycetota bacterium]